MGRIVKRSADFYGGEVGLQAVDRPGFGIEGRGLISTASGNDVFPGFFAAGFECSTFRRRSGQRVDLVAASQHDRFAEWDYARLQERGIRLAREGLRWHLVEQTPGHYNFSSAEPIVRGSLNAGVQVIWDLCHFGWPDHLDIFGAEFPSSLARYGAAFARWLAGRVPPPWTFVPVNEISFFSWASGDEGSMFPFVTGRGFELKQQLVRAAIAAMDAIRAELPQARFLHVEPVINVIASPDHPEEAAAAEAYRLSQFQAWDMMAGLMCPELGGSPRHLDLVGVNYYPQNQWFYNIRGTRRIRKWRAVNRRNPLYKPFRTILAEVCERYSRPVFIAETGAEDGLRRSWFRYVCGEVGAALSEGLPIRGVCLYPILNHPGWVDDRHCHNGLWDYPDEHGNREIYRPLAHELRRWQRILNPRGASPGPVESDAHVFST